MLISPMPVIPKIISMTIVKALFVSLCEEDSECLRCIGAAIRDAARMCDVARQKKIARRAQESNLHRKDATDSRRMAGQAAGPFSNHGEPLKRCQLVSGVAA
jgi:hypothetical protein